MTTRERYCNALDGKPVDRLPTMEWATWWDKTIQRWESEGVPTGLDRVGLYEYFGLDVNYQLWIPSKRNDFVPEPSHGAGVMRTIEDYERIRPTLYPDPESIYDAAYMRDVASRHDNGDFVLWFTLDGFFWFPRQLFGIEPHMYAFYDEPELYHRINTDLCDYFDKLLDWLFSYVKPDFMTFAEDMSYNHGPMLSEKLFDTFLLPYYRRIIPTLKRNGVRVLVDSDGNITEMIPWLLRAGLDGLLPLERQSGVDINLIRSMYPDFVMVGGYDKMVMNQGEDAIRAEFERILPVMQRGRYIPSVDHQTPPGVSLEQYRVYLKLLNEYVAKQ